MPKVGGEKDTADADFGAQLKIWEAEAKRLPYATLRESRADLLLGMKEGREARLSFKTLSVGESRIKAELATKAENLIASTMPIYDHPRRSPAMEGLRQDIKQGFAHWLAESGHTTWAHSKTKEEKAYDLPLDRGDETGPSQAWLAVQAMADTFGEIMQSEPYIQTLAEQRSHVLG